MKRLLCLLLALLTAASTASADSLKTTLEVPDHIKDTLVTNTGLTVIDIDADIEIPDVDRVNLYDYVPTRIPEEQALTMARALGLDAIKEVVYEPYTEETMSTVYTDYGGEFFDAWNTYRVDTRKYVFGASNYVWHGAPYGGHLVYRFYDTKKEYSNVFPIHRYGELPENCAYSREEARRMALDLAIQVVPDYLLAQEGVITGAQYIFGNTPEEYEANWDDDLFIPTAYRYVFNRVVDGVPITVADWLHNPYDRSGPGQMPLESEYMPYMENESFMVVLADEGFQEVQLTNPFAVGEVIEENPELLPFSAILDVAESILPLKMLTFERDERIDQYHVVIDRISFGYMRVLKPDAPREFMLVPVWDFFGNQLVSRVVPNSYDPKTKSQQWYTTMTTSIDTSFLTIDARTGLVIDRNLSY